jgi:hypothetical protein
MFIIFSSLASLFILTLFFCCQAFYVFSKLHVKDFAFVKTVWMPADVIHTVNGLIVCCCFFSNIKYCLEVDLKKKKKIFYVYKLIL